MKAKTRLDTLLFDRGLAPSLPRAQALIMAGQVLVNEHKIDKPGTSVAADASVRLLGDDNPYVSRGGLKLAHALKEFGVVVTGKVALDVGASTGGFTDCLLQAGAARVYAVDVGYGQLAEKLRQDPRVVNMERTNIRALERLPEAVSVIVIDASFISLRLVLPPALALLAPRGEVIALIKPQFEVGKEEVEDGGVVRDTSLHQRVTAQIAALFAELALEAKGVTPSPITGKKEGNQEFLIHGISNK